MNHTCFIVQFYLSEFQEDGTRNPRRDCIYSRVTISWVKGQGNIEIRKLLETVDYRMYARYIRSEEEEADG